MTDMTTLTTAGTNMTTARKRPVQRRVETRNCLTALYSFA